MTTPLVEAEIVQAEDRAVRGLFGNDDPNPALGTPDTVPPPPANDHDEPAPRPLSPREQIAERAKAARNAQTVPLEESTQNDMGEYVPPYLRREEAANDDQANDNLVPEAKTYTLKVRGNDVPVASRDELLQLAEVEAEDAGSFTDAALIKLAQKQMAANAILDEAKAAKKSARLSDRADESNTSSDPSDQDPETPPARQPQHQRLDHKAVIEAIQFGDADEAGNALQDFLRTNVNETLTEIKVTERMNAVESMIQRSTIDFETANADLVQDEDFADLLYNKHLVAEFKKDLKAAGLPQERIDATLGNHISKAMQAYIAVAADGRVKLRTPDLMLAAAAQNLRAKLGRPAPTRDGASTPATPPVHDRIAAKRTLASQPSRASVPLSTAAPKNGQSPQARQSVVAKMRAARGQG